MADRFHRHFAVPAPVTRVGLAAFAFAFAFAGCRSESVSPPRPHIVLISLDTLRRDAVGAYADLQASRTPNLDAFAATGTRFANAFVPMPFTLPSHMSLFTGLYPDVHRVVSKETALGDGIDTLPARLRDAGYATLGVVTNAWMKPGFGFGRGFDQYDQLEPGDFFAERVNQRALALLDGRGDDERPVFLFLHFLDPN